LLFPLFLKLAGREVLLVGGGPVATSKARSLAEAGARVRVVSPDLTPELAAVVAAAESPLGWTVRRRPFEPADLDGVWLVISAAPPDVNRAVSLEGEARRVFVVAVDDPPSASAYGAGIVRRGGVTLAISTAGHAPALAGLLREGMEAVLPESGDLEAWMAEARRLRPTWRREGLPLGERRPHLLAALNRLYGERATAGTVQAIEATEATHNEPSPGRSPVGKVTLVGAGPGSGDLLTVRGVRKLGEADLVLYDALSSEEMRVHAPAARWFYVGKRACRQSIGQDLLNRLMIREARRGHAVVRLKCGDPFVFGRGGEELVALAAAGIPCEIVPGVSSAIAGPLLAGIPVTHRGAASAFTVIAGHHPESYAPLLAGLPREGMTLVVLMGLRQRAAIAAHLLALGWASTTPAAIVLGAATPQAWSWRGPLAALGAAPLPSGPVAGGAPDEPAAPGLLLPGVLIIGAVVEVAAEVEALRSTFTGHSGAEPEPETETETANPMARSTNPR